MQGTKNQPFYQQSTGGQWKTSSPCWQCQSVQERQERAFKSKHQPFQTNFTTLSQQSNRSNISTFSSKLHYFLSKAAVKSKQCINFLYQTSLFSLHLSVSVSLPFSPSLCTWLPLQCQTNVSLQCLLTVLCNWEATSQISVLQQIISLFRIVCAHCSNTDKSTM